MFNLSAPDLSSIEQSNVVLSANSSSYIGSSSGIAIQAGYQTTM